MESPFLRVALSALNKLALGEELFKIISVGVHFY